MYSALYYPHTSVADANLLKASLLPRDGLPTIVPDSTFSPQYRQYKMSLKQMRHACWGLIIRMQAGEKLSLEQIRAFLEGSKAVRFEAKQRRELYEWVNGTLGQQGYER